MKKKLFRPDDLSPTPHIPLIVLLLLLVLILLIPSGGVLADSNAPTVTNTPEPTDPPTAIPDPPTQTLDVPVFATSTPIPIFPTEIQDNTGMMNVVTPQPPDNGGGLSTLNRILLMVLGITVVIIVGVIVYIFINQTRGV